MAKQWKGFNSEWLEQNKHRTHETEVKQIKDEMLNITIAKGIHANNEEELHMAIVHYIALQYPDHFPWCHSDMSGFRLGIKGRAKLSTLGHSRGFPDLVVYHKVWHEYQPGCFSQKNGLAIEIKMESNNPYKKSGGLKADIHIEEQHKWLAQFESLGFVALFAVGFNEARDIINRYLTEPSWPDPGAPGG